jgi:membrane protein implicated in regulation of membrane protease activity
MPRFERVSPWYWVMLAALILAGFVYLGTFFFDWLPAWLRLATLGVLFLSLFVTTRVAWRRSEPPALRRRRDD